MSWIVGGVSGTDHAAADGRGTADAAEVDQRVGYHEEPGRKEPQQREGKEGNGAAGV